SSDLWRRPRSAPLPPGPAPRWGFPYRPPAKNRPWTTARPRSGGDIYIGESLANNHSQISTRWKFTSGTNANQWIILSNYAGGPAIRLNYGTYSSIAQINVAEQISIYPNPTTGILNIEGIKGANVEVLNIMGQVVETIENTSEFNTIDMSRYSNGTYFVKVIVGNNVTTSKINLIK
ncbi:MAG: T9SS type A sorting domain-containing protein, partial [Bacteroidales bacterium]|nr:T9SS type A sorting domain-containing protein [Bacteroidales bacterium]